MPLNRFVCTLIVIYLFPFAFGELEDCDRNVRVTALLYNGFASNFNEAFSVFNQYGQMFSLRFNSNSIQMKRTQANTAQKRIYESVRKRKVVSALAYLNDTYYGLVDREGSTEAFPRRKMIKIKLISGHEDPSPQSEQIYSDQRSLHSVTIYHIDRALTYTQFVLKSQQNSLVFVKLRQNKSYLRKFTSYEDFLGKLKYQASYIVPFNDEFGYVIYANSSYAFHYIEKALEMSSSPLSKTMNIQIEGDRDAKIEKVHALVRTPTFKDKRDLFYIIGDEYRVYKITFKGSKFDEMTMVGLKYIGNEFDSLIESIRIRKPLTATTNTLHHYIAVEKDVNWSESNPSVKVSRYDLFYGKEVENDEKKFDDHPNQIHAVVFPRHEQHSSDFDQYSMYLNQVNDKWNLYLHKNGDEYGTESKSGKVGPYDMRMMRKAPFYIFPSMNSEKSQKEVFVIYSTSSYAVTSLNDALRFNDSYAKVPPKVLPIENDCTELEPSTVRPIGLNTRVYTPRSTTKMQYRRPPKFFQIFEKASSPRSFSFFNYPGKNLNILCISLVVFVIG